MTTRPLKPVIQRNSWRAVASVVLFGAAFATYPAHAIAQSSSDAAKAKVAERDGSHDFDPLLGKWKYHLKRRLDPLTGSNKWIDLEGTGECRKVWDSGANIDQINVDGGGTHIEGLTLRTYNP